MSKRLLMGNEAFAHAALEAGIAMAAGCPGFPANEVIEACARLSNQGRTDGLHVEWSIDEAAALGVCAAVSMSGLRSLFSCKSAGLNVASDTLISLSYTGVRGGLVLCVADDPGARSSATEQDTREFAAFAKIPVLDPATPEQGFAMMARAFELSETTQRPVILRTTTKICNTSTFFDVGDRYQALPPRTFAENFMGYSPESVDGFVHDPKRWSLYSPQTDPNQGRLKKILAKISDSLNKVSHTYTYDPAFAAFNPLFLNGQLMETAFEEIRDNAIVGIVSSGDSSTCVLETLEMLTRSIRRAGLQMPEYRFIQVGTPFPFPHRTLTRFFKDLKHVLVIEQLSSFIEEEILKITGSRFLAPTIHGRLTGESPGFGELTVEDTLYCIARFFDNYADANNQSHAHLKPGTDLKAPSANDQHHKKAASSSENAIAERLAVLQKHTSYTDIVDHMAGPGAFYSYSKKLPARNPVLCAGCPHRGSMFAVKSALSHLNIPRSDSIISGDFGCQLLGSAEPLDVIDASLCLGAASSLAQGFAAANAQKKSIAFIGDSSLISSSLPSIENAVHNLHDVTFIILDNKVNAADGIQPDASSTTNILKARTFQVDAAALLRALGVQSVHKANPLNRNHAEDACRKGIQYSGPSAVVFESPCIYISKNDKLALVNIFKCTGCKKCIVELGCPAIKFDPDAKGPKSGRRGQAVIDHEQCNGCGLCTQICAYQAIKTYRRDAVPNFEPSQRLDPHDPKVRLTLGLDDSAHSTSASRVEGADATDADAGTGGADTRVFDRGDIADRGDDIDRGGIVDKEGNTDGVGTADREACLDKGFRNDLGGLNEEDAEGAGSACDGTSAHDDSRPFLEKEGDTDRPSDKIPFADSETDGTQPDDVDISGVETGSDAPANGTHYENTDAENSPEGNTSFESDPATSTESAISDTESAKPDANRQNRQSGSSPSSTLLDLFGGELRITLDTDDDQ